jgi:hypothetical protein
MSKTHVYDRFDVGADAVSNVRPEMYEVPCSDGDWVKAEDAINREAVLQAEIRTLQVQLKEARQTIIERCAALCDEYGELMASEKDSALLVGKIDLSNAMSGEPRAASFLAGAIRKLMEPA